MKIDESCINHNAIRLIEEIASPIYECLDEKDDNTRIAVLGGINGILDLARVLKEVLKID